MRRLLLCSFIAVLVAGAWSPAAAQPGGEGWDVRLTPYILGPAMDGTTTMRGREADVELSVSDIFSHLRFGAMGLVVARKGNWGVGADLIWMSLGDTTVRNTDIAFKQGAFAFYGLRRLGAGADLTFGVRVNTLEGNLTSESAGVDGFAVSQHKTWVDPIAGIMLGTAPDRPFALRLYGEMGGWGPGSDFTWQFVPTLAIRFTDRIGLDIGYRLLDVDYETDQNDQPFAYDVLTQGPVVGVTLGF